MNKGLFITATDTNVGKTITAAALLHRYREQFPLCYWKPIQTGIEIDDDTAMVRKIGHCSDLEIYDQGLRLPRPLSPHLSAAIANIEIKISDLIRDHRDRLDRSDRSWIIEGAGGLFVPLNKSEMMIDLIAQLALPTLVVARSGLGTINHTLLTLSALRARQISIAGVVMVGELNSDNRAAIEHYGNISVIAQMPIITPLNPQSLRSWIIDHFDPDGHLNQFLQ